MCIMFNTEVISLGAHQYMGRWNLEISCRILSIVLSGLPEGISGGISQVIPWRLPWSMRKILKKNPEATPESVVFSGEILKGIPGKILGGIPENKNRK